MGQMLPICSRFNTSPASIWISLSPTCYPHRFERILWRRWRRSSHIVNFYILNLRSSNCHSTHSIFSRIITVHVPGAHILTDLFRSFFWRLCLGEL